MTFQTIVAGAGADVRVNDNFDAVASAGLYGKKNSTTTGLVWGYYGGIAFGSAVIDGTVALTASSTNYVVANRSTGVVSASTANTNWVNSAYVQLFQVITGASSITSWADYRQTVGALTSAFTGGTMSSAINEAAPVTIASAATVNIGAAASNSITVSGTTSITAFDTIAAGALRHVTFSGILTLTYNATSLILPGSASILTAAGDVAEFVSLGGGNWKCNDYVRASGVALVGGGSTLSETVNPQTGTTYTYLTGDTNKLVTHTNASAIAGTLPQAGASFPSGWWMDVQNRGAGTLTITATTSTIDGASSLALTTGQGVRVVSDGTNYFTQRGMTGSGGGSFTGGTLTSGLNEAPTVTIASSASLAIGAAAGNSISVTGTTAITSFDTIAAGAIRRIVFAGALTLTHSGTALILPGAASITTAAGDIAEFVSLGTGNWRCTYYTKASGAAIVSSGLSNFTESVNSSAPNATIPAVQLLATNAATTVDAVFAPKGGGALLAQIPDNTTTGGNKRGTRVVDLQMNRLSNLAVATGNYSCIPGGSNNLASGAYSFACNQSNTSSGQASFCSGASNVADGINSEATGSSASTKGVTGAQAWASGQFAAVGDAQARRYVLRASTTSATAVAATTDAAAAAATNQVTLPAGCCVKIRGHAVARNNTTGSDMASFDFLASGKQISGTASLVGTPTVTQFSADTGMTACALTLVADTTNKAITINCTGLASNTIHWTVTVEAVEVS